MLVDYGKNDGNSRILEEIYKNGFLYPFYSVLKVEKPRVFNRYSGFFPAPVNNRKRLFEPGS
ncbi:MAG: hypothetical protein ABS68_08615 [Niastella sp. SCN 39-18]|nr:MAG: hypothetical protein ABS68_08615 [Niastella sp. SCN 39-18]OJW11762.1 MAG: hypothetical protein BGO53_12675 [Sphingobacteriales bacterium 39-19]